MGTTNKPQQVKLFASILFQGNEDLLKTLDMLSAQIGAIEETNPCRTLPAYELLRKGDGQGPHEDLHFLWSTH